MFADPRSDLRVIAIFDDDGRLIRTRAFSVPFGVLATDPHTRTLIALRRLNGLELVVYAWRWTEIQ
jgi:hypothetical protein